jgi:hypothetical protein
MNASVFTSIVRHLLGIGSGWLLAKGIELDSGTVETVAGSIGSLLAVGWSLWSKRAEKVA